MTKFYRWLTVAPLGDDAFLKASRISDLHSLRCWSVASSIGLLFFDWMILFCSGNADSHGKQWIFHQQAFYLPNPTNLTNFLPKSALGLENSLSTFYSFERKKYNLFLLLISPWTQIKQLSPHASLHNLLIC